MNSLPNISCLPNRAEPETVTLLAPNKTISNVLLKGTVGGDAQKKKNKDSDPTVQGIRTFPWFTHTDNNVPEQIAFQTEADLGARMTDSNTHPEASQNSILIL